MSFWLHCVHSDNHAFKIQLLEQFRNGRDFIGLLVDGLASQDDAILNAPGGDTREHTLERFLVMVSSERLCHR